MTAPILTVALYRVGRNLCRAVRTCASFGVTHLVLVKCTGRPSGHLYSARGQVAVLRADQLPEGRGVLALETGAGVDLGDVDWSDCSTLLLGGETDGLPRRLDVTYAHIALPGRPQGLTVEAALAIALYGRMRWMRCH